MYHSIVLSLGIALTAISCTAADSTLVDTLTLGDAASETAHRFTADRSDVLRGGLNEPARRLLPLDGKDWQGGKATFTLRVRPDAPNYFTIRLWGDDISNNRLILYCDGKQIGYRHLGDIELLDQGSDAPMYNGRFYYTTTPLPLDLTRGKSELQCEIRSTGSIWGYGTNFEQYQHAMTEPTRGIYTVYTHTDAFFVPPESEKQGHAPASPPLRKEPGLELLDAVKSRVNGEVTKLVNTNGPLDQVRLHLLAQAFFVKWTSAYQNAKVAGRVTESCDALYAAWRKDPKLAQADPAVYNADWFGLGMAADAVRLTVASLKTLDQNLPDGTKRREGWSAMFQASRDWHRQHRRLYTNQSMISDLNVYRANRGVAAIDPAHALPEKDALRYLYESIGLQPWLGNDTDAGPAKPVGDNYLQLTTKGLTKELGFVGYYGEVLDWVTLIYDATREPGQPGDAKIKAQLEKIARARAAFRHPMLDEKGFRAMRAETVVGWRDVHFPGCVCYGERATWDASALYVAAATLDPHSVGYAQQMFADNQFFEILREQMLERGLRTTTALLGVPDQYELVKAQPPSPQRLPMSPEAPDFVFSDEEDGVLAVKHGNEILYASLYWRARYAVNFLARVHYMTPQISRIAIAREDATFEPSGLQYTRPDWTNMGFANGGHRYPGQLHSAHAGEKLPIAKIPDGISFKSGQENVYAGKASFYSLRFGKYLIGMNCTKDKTFDLAPGNLRGSAVELVSGKHVQLAAPLKVPPMSTVVLCAE